VPPQFTGSARGAAQGAETGSAPEGFLPSFDAPARNRREAKASSVNRRPATVLLAVMFRIARGCVAGRRLCIQPQRRGSVRKQTEHGDAALPVPGSCSGPDRPPQVLSLIQRHASAAASSAVCWKRVAYSSPPKRPSSHTSITSPNQPGSGGKKRT